MRGPSPGCGENIPEEKVLAIMQRDVDALKRMLCDAGMA